MKLSLSPAIVHQDVIKTHNKVISVDQQPDKKNLNQYTLPLYDFVQLHVSLNHSQNTSSVQNEN